MPTRAARAANRAGSGTRFWLHYDDPTFERYGGIYVPYRTQREAELQVASDLRGFDNDVKAYNLLGMFKAEYGSHEPTGFDGDGRTTHDYSRPWGHLDKDARMRVATPAAIARAAVKRQDWLVEQEARAHFNYLKLVQKALRGDPKAIAAVGGARVVDPQNAVPGNAYRIVTGATTATGAAIALAAATAKTLVAITSGTANQFALVEWDVSFDGATATAVPALVELISSTVTTAGTSTAATPKQIRGWPAQASQNAGAINYTAEGTTLEFWHKEFLPVYGGIDRLQAPLGREPTGIVTAATQFKMAGLRVTAPAIVNAHAVLEFEE